MTQRLLFFSFFFLFADNVARATLSTFGLGHWVGRQSIGTD